MDSAQQSEEGHETEETEQDSVSIPLSSQQREEADPPNKARTSGRTFWTKVVAAIGISLLLVLAQCVACFTGYLSWMTMFLQIATFVLWLPFHGFWTKLWYRKYLIGISLLLLLALLVACFTGYLGWMTMISSSMLWPPILIFWTWLYSQLRARKTESKVPSSLEEPSMSPPKIKVSSLQAGRVSDLPEREVTSNLADVAALKDLCWIPFGVKTIPIDTKGGILYLHPISYELEWKKDDTIFVEVPPDAVNSSANVEMHYAIIPAGPFPLPEGYQLGSMVVYIYYDGQRVTKPLKLHLPHWYGGKDHTRDGLSFAIASHSLKGKRVYHFKLLAGGEFRYSSNYGVVEIYGHCSLFTAVFKLGARPMCQAFCLEKEKEGETECKIAVTYASLHWTQILRDNRPSWKVSDPHLFRFKSDKIAATLEKSCDADGDWHATFIGASELPSSHVQYDCLSIASDELLEEAVKNSSYPPTITCAVNYMAKMRRTGRSTRVRLHISGMKPEMDFQCTAYERIPGGNRHAEEDMGDGAKRVSAATPVQVIQDHAKDFLQKMNCKEIVSELRALALIPESVENSILHSKTREEANTCLLNHLKEDADEVTVSKVFRIASEKAGYGKMNAFAASLLKKLQ